MSPAEHNGFNELSLLREEVGRLRQALNRLTPGIEVLLRRRGFRIHRQDPSDDLLAPAKRYLTAYYQLLHRYSFRLFLRDVIKHQDGFTVDRVARYATQDVTREYLAYLTKIGLVRRFGAVYRLKKRPITSFGETLEWYVAEIFKREFGAEALWGVKFRKTRSGGDYDVIAKVDGALLYAEVKSSPPKQIYDSEVAAFLDRVDELSPEIAVFLMDTELRMKDKLVPMFEAALARRHAEPPAVSRMEQELFQVGNRIFIVNAKESIVRNISKVLSWYYSAGAGRLPQYQ